MNGVVNGHLGSCCLHSRFDRHGFSTVLYVCSLFGFSCLGESLVMGQSSNRPLCLLSPEIDKEHKNFPL